MSKIIYFQSPSKMAADYWLQQNIFGTALVVPINRWPIRMGVLKRHTLANSNADPLKISQAFSVIELIRPGDLAVIAVRKHYYIGKVVLSEASLWHFPAELDLATSQTNLYGFVDHFFELHNAPLSVKSAFLADKSIGIFNQPASLDFLRSQYAEAVHTATLLESLYRLNVNQN